MGRVRVKICGVRSIEEAEASIEAGADALGFNFWPSSPRYIAPEEAEPIAAALPPFVSIVGVFVNETAARIVEVARLLRLDAVQLHGDETPEFCSRLDWPRKVKAIRVEGEDDLEKVKEFRASAILLDTKVKGSYGGTGERFDWRLAARATRLAPIILAGGLKLENVREAIDTVRPFAIDVCSGVEARPGHKDLSKLRAFMLEVRKANGA